MALTLLSGPWALVRGPCSVVRRRKRKKCYKNPGPRNSKLQDIQVEEPASMAYNATEGNFVNAEGEKETQPGVLNWIADNPTKSSLAALPLMMGAGFALDAGSKFGNESVARRGLKSSRKIFNRMEST